MQPPDRGVGGFSPSGRGSYPKNKQQQRGSKLFLTAGDFPVFGSSQQQQKQKPTLKDVLKKEIIYQKKGVTEKVLTVSFNDVQWKDDPWHIKERYFGTQNYAVQDNRHRYIYETILIETESVQIKHNHHVANEPKSPMTHSSCHIVKVLHESEWALDPSRSRIAKNGAFQYNYWDYMLAWSFTFYYQNPVRKHTWFFTINPKTLAEKSKGFPNWFLYWWEKHGPPMDILPESLKNPWLKWYDYHPKLKGKTAKDEPIGLSSLTYFAEFQIPWIWRWDFEFGFDDLKIPVIYRNFHVKWWDNCDTEAIVTKICQRVLQYEAEYKQTQHSTVSPPTDNIFQFLLKDIQTKYPDISPGEQQLKVTEVLKQQFLAHQELCNPKLNSATPHQGSTSSNPFKNLEDSQDPNASDSDASMEGSKSEASMTDYWDAIIALQEEQLEKQLDKKQQQKMSKMKGLDDL